MKIAITGGRGYLGRNFINFCKNKKIKVIKLPKVRLNEKKNFYSRKGNLSEVLNRNQVDTLIHFAGIRKKDCENSIKYSNKSIYILSKYIANEIKALNDSIRLIFISSDHVFDGKSKLYSEKNLKNLKPGTRLGVLKLRVENYIKNYSKNWLIVRLSAVMDDPRLSGFVLKSLQKKKKIDLFTNVYFSPVIKQDLCNLLVELAKKNVKNRIIHCSGNKRINKYNFYVDLFGNKKNFQKSKIKINKFHPSDLSMSNKITSSLIRFKFTNFKRSLEITRRNLKKL